MAPCQSNARDLSWSRICWKPVLVAGSSACTPQLGRLTEKAEIWWGAESFMSNLSCYSFNHGMESGGWRDYADHRDFLCYLYPIAFMFPDTARVVSIDVLLLPESFIG